MGNVAYDAFYSIRSGFVTAVDPKKATAKVKFEDLDDLVSFDMQIIRDRALGDREYWMPELEEQVLCLFLGNGIEAGFILGGMYSEKHPPPVTDKNKHHIAYKDESYWEYDRKEHKYTVKISGKSLDEQDEQTGQQRQDGGERGGKVDIFIEETTDVYGKGTITIKTDADVVVQAEGKVDVTAKGDVTVRTESNARVKADKDIDVDAGENLTLKAGKRFKVEAETIDMTASSNIKMDASKIDIG